MARTTDETTCTVCAVRLVRRWNATGTDFTWLDDSGRSRGGQGGPAGVDNIEDYLDWLRDHDMRGYSAFLAQVTLGAGLLPWQHWHRSMDVPVVYDPGEVLPWCCGEPAQLIRDGWICRENSQHRPLPGVYLMRSHHGAMSELPDTLITDCRTDPATTNGRA